MANIRVGLSYYSVDTDRYLDIRIRRLVKAFGCDGIAVYYYLLCNIYRVKGCFAAWDESTAFDVSEYWDLKESQVEEIVKYCCAIGLFDKGLFTNGRVITSRAIQIRYIEMSKLAKRNSFDIPDNICLIQEEIQKLPEKTRKLLEVSDKVEYSREKKSKEKYPPPLSPAGGNGGCGNNLFSKDSNNTDGTEIGRAHV